LALIPAGPGSVNGAPLHFQVVNLSARHGRAQTLSIGAHVAVVALLLYTIVSPHTPAPARYIPLGAKDLLSYIPPLYSHSIAQRPSLGRAGSGGENDPRRTRSGNLAPISSMPLAPPRSTNNDNPALPAPPAVLDANAPASVPTITNLGLPWVNRDTDSAGPGGHHGFGSGTGGSSMGDGSSNGAGDSDSPYVNVVSPVTCLYCPEPLYSEEARKAKLQGKMLLRVLVGTDGKAQRIQILQGLGMGLDERAEETIRTWRFSPGRDAAKRPVAAWVTIETRFQLF
jgi:periplasmic protein TonB